MRSLVLVGVFSAALLSLGSGQIMAPAAAKYDPTDDWQGLPAGEGREGGMDALRAIRRPSSSSSD
jgi:hypothetical protein